MNGLSINNLAKGFGALTVFEHLDLEVARGEQVVVFGPSGCGKTLLLRLIAGIYEPDAGDIRIGSRSVVGVAPEQRGVGMAFQNFALYPHMPAFDNIASPLLARATDVPTLKSKVQGIARLLKIDHVLSHEPRELSNGQKQRTALARALVAGPDVLLLDDPLRNVDAKLRYEMRLELPRLLNGFRSTVLYVTQDYKEAMALGQRIAVLIGGRFVQIAPPAEIYARPATIEVARLFGDPTINLLPGDVNLSPAGASVVIAGTSVEIGQRYAHAAGRRVTLGIRPEAIQVTEEARPGAIPVELVAVTPLNERSVMLLRLADGREVLASEPELGSGSTRRHGPAFAAIEESAVLLFDEEAGRRISARDDALTRQ